MNTDAAITLGLAIGASVGFVLASIMAAGKIIELKGKIADLTDNPAPMPRAQAYAALKRSMELKLGEKQARDAQGKFARRVAA
jgi:hypothetical protein